MKLLAYRLRDPARVGAATGDESEQVNATPAAGEACGDIGAKEDRRLRGQHLTTSRCSNPGDGELRPSGRGQDRQPLADADVGSRSGAASNSVHVYMGPRGV